MAREPRAGIAAALAALREGRLVGMPTETVYGLAADATDPRAVAAIFAAKGRPRFNPLIAHVATAEAAAAIAILNPDAERLAGRFWPGPMTLVLPKAAGCPVADLATAGLDTIAVRVPAHPVAHELLRSFGRPLAAPSANRSGHVSASEAGHVAADLGDRVAVILDAGPTPIGVESTIVRLTGDVPVLLRPGGVARSEIEAVLGRPLAAAVQGGRPSAPGMLASHYAPKARLRLDARDLRPGEALLAFGPSMPGNADDAVALANLSPTGDLVEAASRLFSALRMLDGRADTIAVMPVPDVGLGEAINDRLRRAAAAR
ncbi:MAG TPA: L-threonylcarbamoyladenylate synthase [Bauldia sp.]|nr:L-threonylcarbamoyladenylate synthase [Bauldia sp.]